MKRVYLGVLFILASFAGKAQFNQTIRTARPGIAIGPFAVGKNIFQIQSGLQFGGYNSEPTNTHENFFAPIAIFRFGITEHIDINTAWEYKAESFEGGGTTSNINGLSLGTIGARINLFAGRNYIPAVGLQLILQPNILSEPYNPDHASYKIVFIAGEKLGEKFSILTNLSAGTNGNNSLLSWKYALSLDYKISNKWRTYIENYAGFSSNYKGYWDTGLAYLVNNNLQFDLFGGFGTDGDRLDYFTNIGVSWRYTKFRTVP
ncbi:MAG: transporter [Cyclobacteriaceae bacterium]|nr:transporter [Cyclobacteriaceae bacterium]